MAKNLVTIRYVGPHPAVEIDPDGLGEFDVLRGETVDVSEDAVHGFLEQPANWELVVSTPKTPVKNTPTAEEAK